MASRAQYLLRIGGSLKGEFKDEEVRTALGGIFDKPKTPAGEPGNPKAGGWPDGFILKGYISCQWDLKIDYPYADNKKNETMVSFRAEIHHTRDGSLFDNKEQMLKEVAWFYHYRDYRWWRELTPRLKEANGRLQKTFGQQLDSLERIIWYRDWQWYCGNSGS